MKLASSSTKIWSQRISKKFVFLFLSITVVLSQFPLQAIGMEFPDPDWLEAQPESEGIDSSRLEEALNYLRDNSGADGTDEVAIIRNGVLIWKGENIDEKHRTWSIGKIFTSTILGLLSDDNICTSESLAMDIEPSLSSQYPGVKLKHFASMTSGYDAKGGASWGNGLDGSATPWEPADPMFTPGNAYLYWDDAANMMGYILTKAAQESMYDFFKRRIADPIGMDPANWDWLNLGREDDIILNYGAKGIKITARELAKVGHLYLNRGNWNGNQLISSKYFDDAINNHVPVDIPLYLDINPDPKNYTDHMDIDGRGIYGFHWWVNGVKADGSLNLPDAPRSTFYRTGFNHNMLFIVPDWNMVIVRLGLDGSPDNRGEIWNIFLKKIGESFIGYYPEAVESFTLVDADSDSDIGQLSDGDTIDLGILPSNLNIRANTHPENVGSVRFGLNGKTNFRTESRPPYALAGAKPNGDYRPWTPTPGSYSLTATPFSQKRAKGVAGEALTITFEVRN